MYDKLYTMSSIPRFYKHDFIVIYADDSTVATISYNYKATCSWSW